LQESIGPIIKPVLTFSFLLSFRLSPDRIAMIVHQGNDFPAKISGELGSYSPGLFTMISDPAHPKTTRALNTYTNDRRDFAYLTPKRRVQLAEIYSAKSCPPQFLHLICSPERLLDLLAERKKCFPDWTPEWIWEPVPEACKPENLSKLLECAGQVAVFSPNELEASELLGHPKPPCSAQEIEAIAEHFHQAGFQAVVIRSGKRGSYVVGAHGSDHPVARFWVPALIEDQSLVLDQTGAGNSFLVEHLTISDDLKASFWGAAFLQTHGSKSFLLVLINLVFFVCI
jgi:hypothetical protein